MNKYLIVMAFLLVAPVYSQEPAESAPSGWGAVIKKAASRIPEIIDALVENGVSIPVYGNYCGPHHGDPTYSTEPIDAVDEACMYHDMCYDPNVGGRYLCCRCDTELIENFENALLSSSLSYRAKAVALAGIGWFAQSSCNCKKQSGNIAQLASGNFEQKLDCV